MIKYFVRTTGERTLDESFSQIDYELLVDTEHNSSKAFVKQLLEIDDYDAVLLEDDIILCKDFKNRIEKIILEHSNELINFFTKPTIYFNSRKTKIFVYNQCTYFPKGMAKKIYDVIIKHHLKPENSYEQMMQKALRILNLEHYIPRPCLVQHIDNGSLMHHNVNFCRRSPYFIDYLEELGITYEEACTKENTSRLMELMKSKFKEVDNK